MVDQQLGQKQAADDPAWEHEGEFFNLWRDRYPDRPKPPKRSVPVTEDEFLTALYDPLVTFVKAREAFDPLAFVDGRETASPSSALESWMALGCSRR